MQICIAEQSLVSQLSFVLFFSLSSLLSCFSLFVGGIVKNTLRPPIPKTCSAEWKKLMEQCWDIDPDARPAFTEITSRLRSMSMELVTKSKKRENKP